MRLAKATSPWGQQGQVPWEGAQHPWRHWAWPASWKALSVTRVTVAQVSPHLLHPAPTRPSVHHALAGLEALGLPLVRVTSLPVAGVRAMTQVG